MKAKYFECLLRARTAYLKPEYCKDNTFKINKNQFDLFYGSGKVLSEEDRYGNKPGGNDVKTPVQEEKNPQKQLSI